MILMQLKAAFDEAKATKGKPTAIITKTVKGKGVSFMEGQVSWHGTAPNDEQYAQAMEELKKAGEVIMSEVKKIATRESYGNALAELGKELDNLVVLDADLAAATKTGIFKKAFPERHIDCGIAECNMMGVAAGLASNRKSSVCQFIRYVCGRTSL